LIVRLEAFINALINWAAADRFVAAEDRSSANRGGSSAALSWIVSMPQ
jgi:hypothetical protein